LQPAGVSLLGTSREKPVANRRITTTLRPRGKERMRRLMELDVVLKAAVSP
jgi:hypothetical protein